MLVLEEREKLECMERNLSQQRTEPTTNQPTQMALTQGFEPQLYWLEASAHTTKQPLLLLVKGVVKENVIKKKE